VDCRGGEGILGALTRAPSAQAAPILTPRTVYPHSVVRRVPLLSPAIGKLLGLPRGPFQNLDHYLPKPICIVFSGSFGPSKLGGACIAVRTLVSIRREAATRRALWRLPSAAKRCIEATAARQDLGGLVTRSSQRATQVAAFDT
jgi:hypothetical protein